jgi:hypothetical protein
VNKMEDDTENNAMLFTLAVRLKKGIASNMNPYSQLLGTRCRTTVLVCYCEIRWLLTYAAAANRIAPDCAG